MASPQIDVDEIIETLAQIRQRGHSAHTVFRDWVNLMLFALQRRDDPYLEIVDDYPERGDMDHSDGQQSVDFEEISSSGPPQLAFIYRAVGSVIRGCSGV